MAQQSGFSVHKCSYSDFFQISQSAHVQKTEHCPENNKQRSTQHLRDGKKDFWNDAEINYILEEMRDLNILNFLDNVYLYFQKK